MLPYTGTVGGVQFSEGGIAALPPRPCRRGRNRLLPGPEPEVSHVISPAGWAARGMVAGTSFGYAHAVGPTGPLRPRNLPRGAENVVLADAGTVPGIGVPTVLLAADRLTGPASRPRGEAPR